jgi:plasmid maintenance system killer protein
VDIAFRTRGLNKIAHDPKAATKTVGARCAKLLKARLDDLRAARNLDEMRHLPGHCHELTGDRAGQLALDLEHPKRLVFVPIDAQPRPDGSLDWSTIASIEIIEIVDYH